MRTEIKRRSHDGTISERLDRAEMFGRLCSKAVPRLGRVGLGWSLSTWAAEPKAAGTGVGWGCAAAAAAAAEFAEEEASSAVQEGEASADVDAGRVAGGTAPCTP